MLYFLHSEPTPSETAKQEFQWFIAFLAIHMHSWLESSLADVGKQNVPSCGPVRW
ncbi:hypothetical protein XENTR_v10021389 [Xenopus tropicalis]|nr:hypothetical protein XENTR_v10021389 [Xenopus tropicalis]